MAKENKIYTLIPSERGQITIPSVIRRIYKISKKTPILIEDLNDGILILKVLPPSELTGLKALKEEKDNLKNIEQAIDNFDVGTLLNLMKVSPNPNSSNPPLDPSAPPQ